MRRPLVEEDIAVGWVYCHRTDLLRSLYYQNVVEVEVPADSHHILAVVVANHSCCNLKAAAGPVDNRALDWGCNRHILRILLVDFGNHSLQVPEALDCTPHDYREAVAIALAVVREVVHTGLVEA